MESTNMKMSALAIACLIGLGACAKKAEAPVAAEPAVTQDIVDSEGNEPAEAAAPETAADAAVRKAYSPYTGKGPAAAPPNFGKSERPTHVFFGDTHHHTMNSGDAFMAGNRLSPEQAYRFARGEEVV